MRTESAEDSRLARIVPSAAIAMLQAFALMTLPPAAIAATPAASAARKAADRPGVSSAQFLPTTLDMPNPERGWYAFGEDISKTSPKRVQDIYNEGFRMAFVIVNLWQYRMSPIPQEFLEMMDRNFDVYRKTGVKVLMRVVYNYEGNSPDAPLQVAMMHLNQIKPIMAANADAIAYVQAGLIGAWGEWHSSTNDLTQPAAKAAIRDALLATVPQSLYVQFRYPHDVMAWLPTPIDAAAAFKGTPQARTGSHNDCFMSSPNDVGTYASAPEATAVAERAYIKAATEYTPYGGETCSGFSPTRQTCTDILKEGPTYHLTYLNRYFYAAFHKQWQAEGCFDEVSRQMGYRLQLDQIAHAPSVAPGAELKVDIDIRNVGWSRIFSARKLVVSLRDKASGTQIDAASDIDMRMLASQATASTRVQAAVKVPQGAPAGNYEVWLSLPDVAPKLVTDARYAVRFANADDTAKGQRWDSDAARFSAGTTVRVQAAPQ